LVATRRRIASAQALTINTISMLLLIPTTALAAAAISFLTLLRMRPSRT
jgi:hypothetical protein